MGSNELSDLGPEPAALSGLSLPMHDLHELNQDHEGELLFGNSCK